MRLSVLATGFALFATTSPFARARLERRCQARFNVPPISTTNVANSNSNATDAAHAATNNTSSSSSSDYNGSAAGGANNASVSSASASDFHGKAFSIKDQFSGANFFDGFEFEDFPDPTNGNVQYLSQSDALGNLAYVQSNGIAVIKVDNNQTIPSGGLRPSVRIASKNSYTRGLFVLDVENMPYGCGVWPAFWLVGPNWPAGGEIDIVEGVNNNVNNQYTIHADPGCTLDTSFEKSSSSSNQTQRRRSSYFYRRHARRSSSKSSNATSPLAFTGTVLGSNCDATIDSNVGCGIQDPSDQTYGSALNANGGGVFATLLSEQGVAIWFFPRASVPADITAQKPTLAGWGSPKAFWSSSDCPTSKYFKAQQIVINTTLCGDWAGSAYSSDGCPGTCADRVSDPSNFDTAQWHIRSVTVYD